MSGIANQISIRILEAAGFTPEMIDRCQSAVINLDGPRKLPHVTAKMFATDTDNDDSRPTLLPSLDTQRYRVVAQLIEPGDDQ